VLRSGLADPRILARDAATLELGGELEILDPDVERRDTQRSPPDALPSRA
jgi:hypothetical protein